MKKIALLLLPAVYSLYMFGQGAYDRRLFVICTYDFDSSLSDGVTVPRQDGSSTCYVTGRIRCNGEYHIDTVRSFSEGAETLKASNRIIMFVHGNNVAFADIFSTAAQMTDLYDVPSFFFAWPAREFDGNMIRNYYASKKNLEESFRQFIGAVDSLALFVRGTGAECSIVFHSLGNLLAERYADYLAGDPSRTTPFTNVILASACVPEEGHALWVDMLADRIANRVYILRNRNDRTLAATRFFLEGGRKMLGKVSQKKHDTSKAVYIDVTDALRYTPWRSDHSYYTGDPPRNNEGLRQLFESLFSGGSPEESLRSLLKQGRSRNGNSYFLKARNGS